MQKNGKKPKPGKTIHRYEWEGHTIYLRGRFIREVVCCSCSLPAVVADTVLLMHRHGEREVMLGVQSIRYIGTA